MVMIRTERMELYALSLEQMNMALKDGDLLAKALDAQVPADVFSTESRQAMTIKISRMGHNDPLVHPWYTYFLLVRSADRRGMGVCGFKGAPSLFGSVELGYAIHEDFRGNGYMTEAVRGMVAWAFTHESCQRVTAETLRNNLPSQRVLQKAGLVLERSAEHMLFWKIDRQEWQEQNQNQPEGRSASHSVK